MRHEELSQTERSDNTSAGSHEVGELERWEGQPRTEGRITRESGDKRTEIIIMGCSTLRLALQRGYPYGE
jgi:hypothetical protein